ncbi:hypothetical protein KIF24_16245 [Micromonospora sp. Llam7]|uniref:hypothetical protein n=1 Tax=Micromonospora tarapacensis TaxID=2835305 RepID=UPI001C82B3AA|nr:hypothetical protein [Micromonospora tarapacensis]MBX7267427.1 hypothetical protein [Micromonospora tarapacensis]
MPAGTCPPNPAGAAGPGVRPRAAPARTEPADDPAFGAVAPEAAPAGYVDAQQQSAPDDPVPVDDEPPPAADPWAELRLSDDAPEIDDIDGD